jgi:hypothetical protein
MVRLCVGRRKRIAPESRSGAKPRTSNQLSDVSSCATICETPTPQRCFRYRDQLVLHGLHGLQAPFFTAHGLHGLQAAFFTAHGLQGLHAPQARFVAHGLQGLHAFLAPQGVHAARRSGCAWLNVFDAAHGLAPFSAITTLGAVAATILPKTAAESGLRLMCKGLFRCFIRVGLLGFN